MQYWGILVFSRKHNNMFIATLLFLGLLAGNFAFAAPAVCDKTVEEARLGETHSYDVAGEGRLYFHTAPNAACINKKVFVIPGDYLSAHTVAGKNAEWVSVNYMAKDGEDYSGWVKADRLKFTGASGSNMNDNKLKFYKKAMAAAKAGKMGVP